MAVPEAFQRVSSGGKQEDSFHYAYLRDFRVEQCKLFQQHKCTNHRPYTCFHWHFMNQRRRRPVRKRDGTFNYSPDTYCACYDENTGICPNGDDCPFLHRNAGDTERRYHLRYYKTSTCVYDSDVRGLCVKNGPHCAFAHGPNDLRSPVYDIRELTGEGEEDRLVSPLVGSLEREKGVLVDDPRWHDSSFVLTYYKTDSCKRPPRLCRQGYACPFYHNNKDRRRSPKNYKYRSTPCPNVKINDEWSDPIQCEQGDQCSYCHTRTEQQFHPEIYKSTRCNDVQATGYCPRGPFCAFAHDDKELSAPRELTDEPMILDTISNPDSEVISSPMGSNKPFNMATHTEVQPFQRAPGAEHRTRSLGEEDSQAYIKKQLHAIDSDTSLDDGEKQRRKQNLLRLSFGSVGAAVAAGFSPEGGTQFQPGSVSSSISDALEGMERMVGQSMEDLSLEELDPTVQLGDQQGDIEALGSSAAALGQSPAAQGFLQSLPSPFSSSFNFNPSLSPFPTPQHMQPLHLYTTTSPLTSHTMSPVPGGRGGSCRAPGSPARPTAMLPSLDKKGHSEHYQHERYHTEALRREVDETKKERNKLAAENERLLGQINELQIQLQCTSSLRVLKEGLDLNTVSIVELRNLRSVVRSDLEKLDSCISARRAMLCINCSEQPRSVLLQPCQHCVLCQKCAEALEEPICPHCSARISNKVTVLLPGL